jgi:DNA-binding transcriptional LysR family regulator
LGFSLLLPVGRGIAVSDRGKAFYERSAAFLSELDRLVGTEERRSSLRIGSFEVFTSYFMGQLVEKYLKDSEVEVHELLPGRLEEALILNKIDVGITYEPFPRPGIEYVKVKALTMGAYVLQGAFRGREISTIPFVVPANPLEGMPTDVRGLDGWPERKLPRLIRYRVDLMTTGIELVRRKLCAIFIPQFVAGLYNEGAHETLQLEKLELPKSMPSVRRDVYIVKRESTSENRAIQQLAKAIRALN